MAEEACKHLQIVRSCMILEDKRSVFSIRLLRLGSLNSSFVTKTFPRFLQVPKRLPAGFGSIPNSIKPCMRCVRPVCHAFRHKQRSCFEMFSLAGAQQHSNKAGNVERVQLVLYYLFFFQLNKNSKISI